MKSIIVGTDFSKGSYVALDVAVDIANKMGTNINLIWVRKDKSSSDEKDQTQRLAVDKMQSLCDEHAPRLHGTITYEVKYGAVADVLGEEAKKLNSPMIVIGTNGAKGYERYWRGSTACRIMLEAPCPTLTIREGFDFNRSLQNIVLPLRINPYSRQKVPYAATMAKIFGSRVHILGLIENVHSMGTLKSYLKQVEEFFAKEGIPFTCIGRRYENFTDSVLQYCSEIKGDMVVVNTEKQRLITRLFLGTNAQQMVHHAQIPVYCIQPKEIGSIAR